jgi:hypothetical protein
MTPLRQRMLEDMQIRNFSENTQLSYLMQESPMYPYMALDTTKFHTPITLGVRFVPNRLFSSYEGAARVGSIPIARSTFRCLVSPCVVPGCNRA